jgi:hypothetical protein
MNQKIAALIMALYFISNSSNVIAGPKGKLAAGYQYNWLTNGFSAKYNFANHPLKGISAQVIIGLLGSINGYIAKANYTMRDEGIWRAYGYGMLGRYTEERWHSSESTMGFGAGAGIEHNWQIIDPNLPPIWFSGEVGFTAIEFDRLSTSYTGLTFGFSAHYYFNLEKYRRK